MNCPTDATKLETIRRIAQAHNSPASNVGAHRLAAFVNEWNWQTVAAPQRRVILPNHNRFQCFAPIVPFSRRGSPAAASGCFWEGHGQQRRAGPAEARDRIKAKNPEPEPPPLPLPSKAQIPGKVGSISGGLGDRIEAPGARRTRLRRARQTESTGRQYVAWHGLHFWPGIVSNQPARRNVNRGYINSKGDEIPGVSDTCNGRLRVFLGVLPSVTS